MTINMHEAKTKLSRLVEALENGSETQVLIARNGKPVACLTAVAPTPTLRRLGIAKGRFTVPASIDDAEPAIIDRFSGDD